jgi:hypothetical protein
MSLKSHPETAFFDGDLVEIQSLSVKSSSYLIREVDVSIREEILLNRQLRGVWARKEFPAASGRVSDPGKIFP